MASLAATETATALIDNVASVVLGKRAEIALVVAGLLAGGHVLVEDVPGVGKTLLAKALARSIGGTVGRVQGTSDLLPADITGVTIFDRDSRQWDFRPGPVFHNVVLVDEINRATPRAQSALLEAMGEGQVTVDGTAHPLPAPFFVIATQNPYGDVGTFPLVEGQADRFGIVVTLGLPGRDAERAVLGGDGGPETLNNLKPVIDNTGLLASIAEVDTVHVAPAIADYVLDIVEATRTNSQMQHGASPRAARTLLQVAKAHAVIGACDYVAPDDVKAVGIPVLAHRLGVVSKRGTEQGRALVAGILTTVPAPAV